MTDSTLTTFWIDGPEPRGALGYGVTAFSAADAFAIVERAGYHLPDDKSTLHIRAGIKSAEIEHEYVRQHMGPMVVRGLWYPFIGIGFGA
jgi:hypothetical protein